MAQDYNSTMNLPSTDFPMRAGLPQKEPVALEQWNEEGLYEELIKLTEGKPLFVLHDGPPYANGDIHMGTALNKVLKDFIIRYKNMAGFNAPFVPGWDTHGLPTELKARAKAGITADSTIPDTELRDLCQEFTLGYLDTQRAQFRRLGCIGEWFNPYITLTHDFEETQVKVFAEMANKGYIYKGLKPVYWCPECNTALAEAEIEYADDPCHSIYVKFRVKDDKGILAPLGADLKSTYFVIWTTTTWTLPGNVAICLGPDFDYALVKAGDEYYVMAEGLYESALAAAEITEYEVLGTVKGSDLEYITTEHPFLDRESLVIVGDHVTLESGTGCVHTAPGHGVEDFDVCKKYPELPIVVPVDHKGILTAEAGEFAGLSTDDANKAIAQKLDSTGNLFALKKIVHQYPHCWRCKKPVLFRATSQWFCSISDFREDAIKAVDSVEWIPEWGHDRLQSMIRERNDWCISRQRKWGVPIPVFYCDKCGKEIIDIDAMNKTAEIFGKEGTNAWFSNDAEYFLPENFTCPHCGSKEGFSKEKDIMDVWFDSGSSHLAVCKNRPYLKWPADVYLEGGDQYRGWFQSSMLTSVAVTGQAPYKTVISHGWVVDGEGRKMSKSLGNGINPDDIVKQYGAEILRLWVASSDYHADIRISPEILKQLSEGYRKIRNTARFILGCIGDFNPDVNAVSNDKLKDIDIWALGALNNLIEKVTKGYEKYEYYNVYHAIHHFCVVDMSNFYLDVIKDRLYSEKADSETRRAAQTVIYKVLETLTLLVAPILAFTSEEIWGYMPHSASHDARHALYNDFPKTFDVAVDDEFIARWDRIHNIRDDVKKALENARNEKVIGSSLDAKVTLFAEGETLDFVNAVKDILPAVFIVSQVDIAEGEGAFKGEVEGLSVTVAKAEGEKCERCWIYSDTVGKDSEHPTLCSRCAGVLK
ncbi:MAG: isoleucine--tRNA ligase [Clostridia bacterium]|nr:isoleucine--tRNA ligase [Clostridia bacterium]